MGKKIRLLLDRTTGKAVMVGDKAIAVHSTDELRISTTATLSQSEYDALATKVVDTLYLISGTSGFIKAYLGSIPLFRMSGTKSVTGRSPIVFSSIDGGTIVSLVRYGKVTQGSVPCVTAITQLGKCEQNGTPTPSASVDIVCNNGALKYSANMANVNEQTALVGYYINASGVVTADTYNWFYQDYIRVKPNTTYTLSMSQSVYYVTISEYSTAADSGFIVRKTGSMGSNTSLTITTGANTNYIRFGTNINRTAVTLAKVLAINWMLNLGGTAMDYQPNVEGGIYCGGTHPGQNLVDLTAVTDGYYYDPNGVYTALSNARLTDYIPVKSGQKYTVYVKAERAGTAANVRCNLFDIAKTWKSQPSFTVNSGSEAVSTITPSEDGYLRVSANYAGTGAKADWSKLQIVRGEYTLAKMPPYEPYTEVPYTPEVLTVGGANLFNASSYTEINAYVNANTGVLTTGSPGSMTQYCAVIPCKPNAQYNITGQGTSAWGAFPSDSIGTTATAFTKGGILTTGANDRYLIGLVRANGDSIDYRNTLVVQEAQTVTDIPILLSVGDTKDTAEIINGIKTGKARAIVFDGTEADWTFDATYDRAIFRPLPNFKSATTRNIELLCTHFVSKFNGEPIGDLTVGDFYNATQNGVVFHVAQTSLEDWKAYLAAQYAAGTPVIVIYPRSTEVTEQATAHPELTNQKYTSASADGNVDDITVTVTRGVTSTPTPYNPIPVICNNGEVTGQGATGTPEALTLRGINLLDNTGRFPASGTWEYGYYKDFASGNGAIPPIHLEAGKTYTLSLNVTSSVTPVGISAGCGNGTYATDIEATEATSQGGRVSITFTPTAAQLANGDLFAFRAPRTDTADSFDYSVSEVQLEEGPSATPYEPYVAPQTATVVDLLQVGDVKDEQDIITGEVARRCAACLYDGTQQVGDTYISSTGGKDIGAVIVYPLDTPATEQVTPQPLDCHSGTNIVESNVSDAVIRIDYPE